MGRWTQYDEDEYRLPDGMTRMGYDSDTGRYLFKDSDGSIWQGPEGAEYGQMTRVPEDQQPSYINNSAEEADVESAGPSRSDGYQSLATEANAPPSRRFTIDSSYRTLFPFFLIIGVTLLIIWRYIISPTLHNLPGSPCEGNDTVYWVEPGDSCWKIATNHSFSLDELRSHNPKLDCDKLMPGMTVCLMAAVEPNAANT